MVGGVTLADFSRAIRVDSSKDNDLRDVVVVGCDTVDKSLCALSEIESSTLANPSKLFSTFPHNTLHVDEMDDEEEEEEVLPDGGDRLGQDGTEGRG